MTSDEVLVGQKNFLHFFDGNEYETCFQKSVFQDKKFAIVAMSLHSNKCVGSESD